MRPVQFDGVLQLESTVRGLFDKNGPDVEDFDTLMALIDRLKSDDIEPFRKEMAPILHPGTIIGFSFTKPFGYNGDFFIIEKIYQQYVSPDPLCQKWDQFFHRLPAAIAVINRKKLAIEILNALNTESDGEPRSVLILGSGPVTEVNEFFQQGAGGNLYFDLVDMDQRAIDYAREKNKAYLDYMTFWNRNIIRFRPDKQYDLIWSAGLFDYFKDKHFVYLLKQYYDFIAPGGKMIIGNFSIQNPSRKIMEVLGDWFLYHRTEADLEQFAAQAGVPSECIDVISEPLGINLFLTIRKK